MVKFKEILMTIYKNKIGFKYPNKVDVRSREKKKKNCKNKEILCRKVYNTESICQKKQKCKLNNQFFSAKKLK